MTLYERFCALDIDPAWIGLEKGIKTGESFCTPIGARVIGWEGCIHYCWIDGFGDRVFAVNPESCAECEVYPMARSFEDFLRLILACGGVTAPEQIAWMSRPQFDAFMVSPDEQANRRRPEVRRALAAVAQELGLEPLPNPYEYVKQLQTEFDSGALSFSDEYYDVKGIER